MLTQQQFDQNYQRGYQGYAEILYQLFKDKIVAITAKNYFIYNSSSELWEPKTVLDVKLYMMMNIDNVTLHLNGDYLRKFTDRIKSNAPLVKFNFVDKINDQRTLLSVKNGVVDLLTGNFRRRTKYDYFSCALEVDWKGLDYNTDGVEEYINTLMSGDAQMVLKLQKFLGYCISGDISKKVMGVFYGPGGNGKTVLMNLIGKLMGDYFTYSENCLKSVRNHKYLYNKRCVAIDYDISLSQQVATSVTDTTRVTPARFIPFDLTSKFILVTNKQLPAMNRVVSIPFLANFRYRIDVDLEELLVWLVRGSVMAFRDGI